MTQRVKLDVIDVAEPCSEDWDAMRGDARARFCDACHRNVFDLSELTRPEAEALVNEHEGRLCVRFYRRADGTVTTSDCAPDRLAAARRKAKKSFAVAAAATAGLMTVVGALGAATALGVVAEWMQEEPEPTYVMGVALMPEPAPLNEPLDGEPPADPNGDPSAEQIVPSEEASEEVGR